jgi:phosphatidyl-myo-inositol dimannoside synthase
MRKALNVMMLLTDGFGGVGGIAKFNRDFLQALDSSGHVQRVYALPRLIPEPIAESIPEAIVYDRRSAAGKTAFMRRLGRRGSQSGRLDLLICGHLYLLPAAWLLARLCGARLALIIHGLEAWVPSSKFLANLLARTVDSLIAVSRFSAEKFVAWSKLPEDRVFILPNCVDLDLFRPQARDPAMVQRYRLQERKVLLTVGRLAAQERYKGFDEVLDIMPRLLERHPDLAYLIVGNGPDRPRLEAKVKNLGLIDHVIFTGYISEAEKAAHYHLADLYVMPSSGEGFGIVLIEAVACGVPVVGSCADGSREALLDGRLGRIVDPRKPDELLDAVSAGLDRPSSHRRNELIDVFSAENFKSRVNNWCREQAAATAGAHL